MSSNFTNEVIKILRDHDCRFIRHGKGDHDIWYSPVSGKYFPVDGKIKSRHTANSVLKQAGLAKRFCAVPFGIFSLFFPVFQDIKYFLRGLRGEPGIQGPIQFFLVAHLIDKGCRFVVMIEF